MGASLFLNPTYSDFTIACGYYTWPAHRAFFCSQSDFFKAALSGGFKEAQESKITIKYLRDAEEHQQTHPELTTKTNCTHTITGEKEPIHSVAAALVRKIYRATDDSDPDKLRLVAIRTWLQLMKRANPGFTSAESLQKLTEFRKLVRGFPEIAYGIVFELVNKKRPYDIDY
ncbi:hypothetical protein BJ508DRAFT_311756 [Ascobolus immersus RN42]|uniref:BTB domain-containing protein n=1 Tax=Ascobolus immersus RN42 TaxID=1160509 RepID=A0A3N4HPB3_ASCIM|nr:hypothetical protein BJ508DRAFT_311756 [Ascobolus immersus RN42]